MCFFLIGGPEVLTIDDLDNHLASARAQLEVDSARGPRPVIPISSSNHLTTAHTASDLLNLKKKFPFLCQYSDEFIRASGPLMLIKAEAASRKLQEYDRSRRAEDKLLANREALASCLSDVAAGQDNRIDLIHPARFLPGPACSFSKLWLKAREWMGGKGHPPVSTYDLASIGLGGSVSARGWVELHDPSSTTISIKMFSMGNTTKGKGHDADFHDMENLAELKNALRALRAAMCSVHPWNRSIDALESYLVQSSFCSSDLANVDKQVSVLTKFVDYVLVENANRWRDMEPFLSTRDLRGTWADFFSQRGQSFQKRQPSQPSFHQKQANSQRPFSSSSSSSYSHQSQSAARPPAPQPPQPQNQPHAQPSSRYQVNPLLFLDDICFLWNIGKCIKPAGDCTTRKGRQLRHVCNFRPDPANPTIACAKDHPAHTNHK